VILSRDGRLAVVVGLPKFDEKLIRRDVDPEDLPQPRAVLIDLGDPKSKPRTLILPSGGSSGLALSPDGKTLAVGGPGAVHLIDLAERPKK
jgi:hypothetical protein